MTRRTLPAATAAGVLSLTLFITDVCKAQSAFFDEGNQRYQAGDFEGALEQYQQILGQGLESGAVYYNIGNAYFKIGQLGRAILSYERARRLMPNDSDLLANLELARSMTTDNIAPRPEFWLFRAVSWWVGLLPQPALAWLVTLAYLVTMGAIILVILRPTESLVTWLRRVALVASTVSLIFGLNLMIRELGIGSADTAVIIEDEVMVQSAPSDDSELQIFAVHEGTKVSIERQSDTWIEIVLEDGKVGWIRAELLEPI